MSKAIVIGSGPGAAFVVRNLIDIEEIVIIEKGDFNGKLENFTSNLKCNIGSSNSFKQAESIGGASNYWGGGFVRYDRIDFNEAKRENFNSWPIQAKELDDYYRKALDICGIPHKNKVNPILPSLKPQLLIQQKKPFNVQALLKVPNVTIFKNYEAIRFNSVEENKIDSVTVKDIKNDKIVTLTADVYVLASGTVNNVRILHNTFSMFSKTIPNALGSSIGTHPKITLGIAKIPMEGSKNVFYSAGTNYSVWQQYGLPDEDLLKYNLPNHSIRFEPIIASKLSSISFKIAESILFLKILDPKGLLFGFLRMSVERLIQLVSALIPSNSYRVRLYLDQVEDTKIDCECSYVNEKELPNFCLRVEDVALKNLKVDHFCNKFFGLFHSDLGIKLDFKKIDIQKTTVVHSHFTGGCIMGCDPERSIVDENCQLHGIDNLFVAGPSVFATHSFCNPFLTIAAMSLRLGEFINEKYK